MIFFVNSVNDITEGYILARTVNGECVAEIIFGVHKRVVHITSVGTVMAILQTILRKLVVDGLVQSVVVLRRAWLTKRVEIHMEVRS